MPVIRFGVWRKFICIKSPWETHDSGPCLNGSSFINNLFMFCLWKINAADKHVFWCHFQMYDDYLSCCCFWKIKDSWFLIPVKYHYIPASLKWKTRFWKFLKKLLAQFISYLAFTLMGWVSWPLYPYTSLFKFKCYCYSCYFLLMGYVLHPYTVRYHYNAVSVVLNLHETPHTSLIKARYNSEYRFWLMFHPKYCTGATLYDMGPYYNGAWLYLFLFLA